MENPALAGWFDMIFEREKVLVFIDLQGIKGKPMGSVFTAIELAVYDPQQSPQWQGESQNQWEEGRQTADRDGITFRRSSASIIQHSPQGRSIYRSLFGSVACPDRP